MFALSAVTYQFSCLHTCVLAYLLAYFFYLLTEFLFVIFVVIYFICLSS